MLLRGKNETKMLICGADGFIGKSALDYFKDRYDITATIFSSDSPSRGEVSGVKYVRVDLRVESEVIELFESQQFDVVLQTAATTTGAKDVVERPYVHVTDNAVMNSWILENPLAPKLDIFFSLAVQLCTSPKNIPSLNPTGALQMKFIQRTLVLAT